MEYKKLVKRKSLKAPIPSNRVVKQTKPKGFVWKKKKLRSSPQFSNTKTA
jgi:hypothetical protein